MVAVVVFGFSVMRCQPLRRALVRYQRKSKMNIQINLELINSTYVFSYQGHSILKIEETKLSPEQANQIYDHLVSSFGNGLALGQFLQQIDAKVATDTFNAAYNFFETAVNLGARSESSH
ncbi:hypothetical protein FLM00_13300 [Vibrio cholerae]|nr:hypothetical protein FLM00_13300 [Vibrio cholerae]